MNLILKINIRTAMEIVAYLLERIVGACIIPGNLIHFKLIDAITGFKYRVDEFYVYKISNRVFSFFMIDRAADEWHSCEVISHKSLKGILRC